jgi:bla regulator protein BlaR1
MLQWMVYVFMVTVILAVAALSAERALRLHRVLRAGRDVVRYGETLVEVGARQSGFIGAVAAMSESRSFLEQRIKIMVRKPNGWWKTSATLLGCMAVCLIAVAAQVSPPNSGTGDSQAQQVVSVDPAVYDGYVGEYKLNDTFVMSVFRDGNRLLTQVTGQPRAEVFPTSNTEYFYKIAKAQITFQTDAQGHATALILHQNGQTINAPRISDQAAQQIADAMNARVLRQAPNPGSEAALRKLYASLLAGAPDYDDMRPRLAAATRQQLPRLEEGAQQLGPIVSVEFRGVGNQGWDVYDLHHEHGMSSWRIMLAADGKIEGALFQAGP